MVGPDVEPASLSTRRGFFELAAQAGNAKEAVLSLAKRFWEERAQLVFGPPYFLGAAAILFLAVPQVYLTPEGTIDVALTTAITVLLAPIVLVKARQRPINHVVWLLLALIAIRLLTLLWSPMPRQGLQAIVLPAQFLMSLLLMTEALRHKDRFLKVLLRVYWPWVALEIALVVLFRIFPGVEAAFLREVASFVAGHNTVASFFGLGRNNVLDPAKSGGVFLNANVAAMFLGVNGLAALAISAMTKSKAVKAIGIAALLAMPFTGSKSATILAVVLPSAALAVANAGKFRRLARPTNVAFLSSGLLLLVAISVKVGFAKAAVEAVVGRTAIWGFGAEAFLESPVLGLGYGGWEAGFVGYAATHAIGRPLPPHNLLLAAWARSGVVAAALVIAFFVLVFRLVVRGLIAGARSDVLPIAFIGAAVAWVLLQGMGENTDIFGEIHLIPILSLLIAHLCLQNEGTKYRGKHGNRRHRETPAVPAIRDLHTESGPGA